jgi:hypothetical protein
VLNGEAHGDRGVSLLPGSTSRPLEHCLTTLGYTVDELRNSSSTGEVLKVIIIDQYKLLIASAEAYSSHGAVALLRKEALYTALQTWELLHLINPATVPQVAAELQLRWLSGGQQLRVVRSECFMVVHGTVRVTCVLKNSTVLHFTLCSGGDSVWVRAYCEIAVKLLVL